MNHTLPAVHTETGTDRMAPVADQLDVEEGKQLAHTGASSNVGELSAAAGLVALGGGAVLYSRRRQNG